MGVDLLPQCGKDRRDLREHFRPLALEVLQTRPVVIDVSGAVPAVRRRFRADPIERRQVFAFGFDVGHNLISGPVMQGMPVRDPFYHRNLGIPKAVTQGLLFALAHDD